VTVAYDQIRVPCCRLTSTTTSTSSTWTSTTSRRATGRSRSRHALAVQRCEPRHGACRRPIVRMRCLSRAVSGRRQERPRASWQPAQMQDRDAPKAQVAGASLTPARPRPARRSELDWLRGPGLRAGARPSQASRWWNRHYLRLWSAEQDQTGL